MVVDVVAPTTSGLYGIHIGESSRKSAAPFVSDLTRAYQRHVLVACILHECAVVASLYKVRPRHRIFKWEGRALHNQSVVYKI